MIDKNPFSRLREKKTRQLIAFVGMVLVIVSLISFIVYQQTSQPQIPSLQPSVKAQSTTSTQPTAANTNNNIFYISKNGNNSDGRSWQTAWNELDQVDWSNISAGAVIEIDGGNNGMMYTTKLNITKSGTQDSPITIMRATDSGHNGPVIFFGGSTTPLPYCAQKVWNSPQGTMGDAILMNGSSYINIDGGSWNGINIYGYTYVAVDFTGGESYDNLSNLEVHDNGSALQSDGAWYPEFPGIGFYGDSGSVSHLTFNHMNVHDNGEDNFQGDLGINDFTIENSWMHYTRAFPGIPQESYNLCVHNDGMQLFGTTPGNNLTYKNDVFGPGLTNGLIFEPQEKNVTLENSLILDPGSNVTVENSNTASGWKIDHITALGQDDNLTLNGTGNTVTNSIFYGGNLLLGGGTVAQSSNNCQWQTSGNTGNIDGQTINPQFLTIFASYAQQTNNIRLYPTLIFLESANFALQPGSPCTGLGASITSVPQFLKTIGSEPTPAS
jgi:hypothetical protein